MKKEIFYANNICMKSPRGHDLNGLNLSLYEGEVLGLFGNRYAGKSALFRVLTGEAALSEGMLLWHGSAQNPRPVIGSVDGLSAMIDDLQVWENVAILWGKAATGFLNGPQIRKKQRVYFQDYGLNIDVNRKTGALSPMEKLLIETLLLHRRARVLLMDLAGVSGTAQEYAQLRALLTRIKQEGVGVLVYSHQMETVCFLADRMAILYDGRIVKQYERAAFSAMDMNRLAAVLFKEEEKRLHEADIHGGCVMRIENLDVGLRSPVSFDINRGELLVVVNSQTDTLQALRRRLLFAEQAQSCTVRFHGRPVQRLAEEDGAYFLNTLYLYRLIEEMTPLENLCLGISDRAGYGGMENRRVVQCLERDFYAWYGHEGLLRQKNCHALYKKDRVAINLFRLRFLKMDVIFCDDLNVHNDLVTYRMIKNALIALSEADVAVCILTSGFANRDSAMDRCIVLDAEDDECEG